MAPPLDPAYGDLDPPLTLRQLAERLIEQGDWPMPDGQPPDVNDVQKLLRHWCSHGIGKVYLGHKRGIWLVRWSEWEAFQAALDKASRPDAPPPPPPSDLSKTPEYKRAMRELRAKGFNVPTTGGK